MNPCKKSIGWADFTWNPCVGCKGNCYYCAAKRMNDRFKWIPLWTSPVFYHDRLQEPFKKKKPVKIFVCFMSDLFGEWICRDWIVQVLQVCELNPHHTFMFLTKNPSRYLKFDYPANVMLGVTITNSYHSAANQRVIIMKKLQMRNLRTFVSLEPILGHCEGLSLDAFDLVIIGAQTGPKAMIPAREWFDNIRHLNIFYKNNILKYFPDLKNKKHELQ